MRGDHMLKWLKGLFGPDPRYEAALNAMAEEMAALQTMSEAEAGRLAKAFAQNAEYYGPGDGPISVHRNKLCFSVEKGRSVFPWLR